MQPGEDDSVERSEKAPAADALQQDLRDIRDGVAKLARDATDRLQAGAGEGVAAATGLARDALAPAQRFVRERPIAALAIAFAAGWLLAPRRR
ncbi:MAG TPA: hypothetical protein VFL14_08025 [Xanthomonadales bacterium]|nr:hypothetical protein [Xanthomonadales bacterium]